MMAKGKVKGKVLFVLDPTLGHVTVYLRGLIFKDLLASNGWDATFVSIASDKFSSDLDNLKKTEASVIEMAGRFDLIYLLKVSSLSFVKKLRRATRARIVFELTDALWKPNFRLRGWYNLEDILEVVDAVFSENEYVCQYGRRYNKNVFSLRACTQTEEFERARNDRPRQEDGKVIIGWIGSPHTVSAVIKILKPLENLFGKYPNLELRMLGCDPDTLREQLKNISFSAIEVYNEGIMIREAINMDIGIFPPPADVEDYKIRGSLKGMIYMSAKVPPVCLNAGDPARIIEDGVNGMLVNSLEEWETKIEKLITDPVLRKNMGERAFQTIKEEHSLDSAFRDLDLALMATLQLPEKTENEKSVLQVLKWMMFRIGVGIGMTKEVIQNKFQKIQLLSRAKKSKG